MTAWSKSGTVQTVNTIVTFVLIAAVVLVAIFDPDATTGKPKLLAGAISVYALYLSLSSLVTRKILGQLVFISRDAQPGQFRTFFLVYLVTAALTGAFALFA
ncbi:MAG: hypothetical protein AB7F96_22120 [Beijerinckiaceae bacterium]